MYCRLFPNHSVLQLDQSDLNIEGAFKSKLMFVTCRTVVNSAKITEMMQRCQYGTSHSPNDNF